MERTLSERIAAAARVLRSHGARQVYVFGSAAAGSMRSHSDVDLAVTGLAPERYFGALAAAYEALGLPLDLVDLDEESPLATHLRAKRDSGELRRVA